MDVGNQQAALAIQKAIIGFAEHGLITGPAIAAVANLARAGHRGDDARSSVHLADHRVQTVDDIDVTIVLVNLQRIRLLHGGLNG